MHLQSYIRSLLLATLATTVQLCATAAVDPIEPPEIKGFEKNIKENSRRLNEKNRNSLVEMATNKPKEEEEPKYFQEPGVAEAGHYDGRFYTGFVTDEERQKTLTHLIRAWLRWTQSQGIETWLAHGTLLGWWWNNHILPWDTDLDVQVSEATLKLLAENFNMTIWNYNFEGDNFQRDYLLDINPYWVSRVRGTSANLIDARWIDKTTGLFIDITGLSETNGVARPGIISCKNLHRYKVEEIYPLREVKFEEFKAYIPNSYEKVLIKEYRSKAFTVTEFSNHDWQPALGSWVPKTRFEPHRLYRLRNGKMMKIKIDDPRGLEAVPPPTFWQLVRRLVYW